MSEYLLLYCLFGLLGYCNYRRRVRTGYTFRFIAWLCFGLVFSLLAFRHPSMGRDLGYYSESGTGYLQSFSYIASSKWEVFCSIRNYLNYEYGFVLLNRLVGVLWENSQFFLSVCAMLSLAPVAQVIAEKSCSPVLSWVIYLALPSFEILFSGLRQGISLGICTIGFRLIQRKKPFQFLLTVLLACCFHSSAWIFLLAYPVYHFRLTKVYRLVSIIGIGVVFFLRRQLFSVLSRLISPNVMIDNNGAMGLLLLFLMIYGLCSFFTSEDDMEQNGYLNVFFLGCVCQVFANVSSLALRIGYYFLLPVVLILPSVLEKMEWQLRVIVKFAVIIFFVVFGLHCIYNSTWSGEYPYYWFWEVRG